jgi:hypothetical protein
MTYQSKGQRATRGCAKGKDMVKVQGIGIARLAGHSSAQPAVVNPVEAIAAIPHGTVQQINARAQPVVQGKGDPASV